ncbi:MAG: aminotransferase class V-fold PLP-dependent enzyme [Woeseiaceae bacterium]|nr:aminotransferase class V-fold PLP-dependent enzyme [Woeseiaceae bacterium]
MTDGMIYLDYAASTPVDARVLERMRDVAESAYANPSSTHAAGRVTHAIIAEAATQLGGLLKVDPRRLIWTSGATESDNLAISGAARYRAHLGKHLVSMRTEHKAVTDVLDMLSGQGFEVTWVEPGPDGVLDPAVFEAALRDDTQFASIMYVNNETGVVQDIAALGAICRDRNILFHVDGAQAAGKLPIDLGNLPVDLMSLTGHKFYGPKGVGALYIADRPDCHVEPILYGGGQQRRIRPGTLPTDLIAGLGMAAEVAAGQMDADLDHLHNLRTVLWNGIRDLHGIRLNGSPDGFPGILNVSIADIEGESLLLDLEPLCVATGSACNSTSQEPSYVLRALGRTDLEAQSAIRFSIGRPTTRAEIEFAVSSYRASVARLRGLAPGQAA